MNDEQPHTLMDLQGFLGGTVKMNFTVVEDERYTFIARTVKRFGYGRPKRADKAVVLRFLERVSGNSRQLPDMPCTSALGSAILRAGLARLEIGRPVAP